MTSIETVNLFNLRPFFNTGWQVLAFHKSPGPGAIVLCGIIDGNQDPDTETFSRYVTAYVTPSALAHKEWLMGHYFYADEDGFAQATADFERRVSREHGLTTEGAR